MVLVYEANEHNGLKPLIYVGKDKFENDQLLRVARPGQDLWFHVDKYSSAHVYLRMPAHIDPVPPIWLEECAQLAREGSREGSQHRDITVIYTACENLKKTADMEVGTVSFHRPERVRRTHVRARNNRLLERLVATKYTMELEEFCKPEKRPVAKPVKREAIPIESKRDPYADVFEQPTEHKKSARELEDDFFG